MSIDMRRHKSHDTIIVGSPVPAEIEVTAMRGAGGRPFRCGPNQPDWADHDRTQERGKTHERGRTHERCNSGNTRVQAAAVGLVAPIAGGLARLAPAFLHGPGERRPLSPGNVRRQSYAVRATGCASHPG